MKHVIKVVALALFACGMQQINAISTKQYQDLQTGVTILNKERSGQPLTAAEKNFKTMHPDVAGFVANLQKAAGSTTGEVASKSCSLEAKKATDAINALSKELEKDLKKGDAAAVDKNLAAIAQQDGILKKAMKATGSAITYIPKKIWAIGAWAFTKNNLEPLTKTINETAPTIHTFFTTLINDANNGTLLNPFRTNVDQPTKDAAQKLLTAIKHQFEKESSIISLQAGFKDPEIKAAFQSAIQTIALGIASNLNNFNKVAAMLLTDKNKYSSVNEIKQRISSSIDFVITPLTEALNILIAASQTKPAKDMNLFGNTITADTSAMYNQTIKTVTQLNTDILGKQPSSKWNTLKTIGKVALTCAVVAGVAYGAQRLFNWYQCTPEASANSVSIDAPPCGDNINSPSAPVPNVAIPQIDLPEGIAVAGVPVENLPSNSFVEIAPSVDQIVEIAPVDQQKFDLDSYIPEYI